MTDVGSQRARVVVLTGPSGSGKSRLAGRLNERRGWPIFRLDDFYREGNDPDLPHRPGLGIPDWDDPASWDGAATIAALDALVTRGRCTMPVYDISTSRATGETTVRAGSTDLVVAEGIFAAEIVAPLREQGLLAGAWCVTHRPAITFARRLARDLAERRKPPLVLWRRGLTLMRDEPHVVARQIARGAVAARPSRIERELRARSRVTG